MKCCFFSHVLSSLCISVEQEAERCATKTIVSFEMKDVLEGKKKSLTLLTFNWKKKMKKTVQLLY